MGDDQPAYAQESPSMAETQSLHGKFDIRSANTTVASGNTDTSITFNNNDPVDPVFIYTYDMAITDGWETDVVLEFEIPGLEEVHTLGNPPQFPVNQGIPIRWESLQDLEVTITNNSANSIDVSVSILLGES